MDFDDHVNSEGLAVGVSPIRRNLCRECESTWLPAHRLVCDDCAVDNEDSKFFEPKKVTYMNNYKFQAGDGVLWQSKHLMKVLADQVGNEVACTRVGEDEQALVFAIDCKRLTTATPTDRLATLRETVARWPEHLCGRWAKAQLEAKFALWDRVRTVKPKVEPTDYKPGARANNCYGVEGEIEHISDSHGLCYTVRHPNGTVGFYEPSELAPLTEGKKMRTHNLKTWPSIFQAVWDGTKTAEFRRNDRDFAVGDELLLQEFEPDGMTGRYTGREILASVTHVVHGGQFGIPVDFCMLSIKVLSKK